MTILTASLVQENPDAIILEIELPRPWYKLWGPKTYRRHVSLGKVLIGPTTYTIPADMVFWTDTKKYLPFEDASILAYSVRAFIYERDVKKKKTAQPPPSRSVPKPNWAAFFGLPSNCTNEQIKAAYRNKAKQAHPDKGGSAEAFRRVTEHFNQAKKDRQFT